MIKGARLYAAQSAAAIRTSFADRGNFAIQVGGMIVNDIFFLTLWVLFFAGFRSIGGWQLQDMALLFGLTMSVVGISGVFFGGYRDLAATLLRGELDALLTQPKGLIPRLLARESIATAWGDLAGAVFVLAVFAKLEWTDLPTLLLAIAAGTTVYVSASISFACLAFWAAGARSFARELTDFMLLFSSYPGSIYQGAVKTIAFTLLPAGFVVLAPMGMVRHPSGQTLAVVVFGAVVYAAIAVVLFHLGVARYRRGASPSL
ncbi:ABC-2 family transporter protein [Phenylobacterium sp.]|uniref:ABC-2 family transporter protein n=1 Tax=Phenylobacterium sp. TaxID=1871053 RepID=UPI002717DCEB|nr:ABC-2 family transporter protein [Phenylobacterium sp.]MDO8802435.1 ABC-2 family transporter protein [Phenylobacterium sp.]